VPARRKRRGRYYLARVRKGGLLTDEKLRDALLKTTGVVIGADGWTFTDVVAGRLETGEEYVFGYLTRYEPRGVVRVLDRQHHSTGEQIARELVIALSPFVYIPSQAGIAYMHVWDLLERSIFISHFPKVVVEFFQNFFVTCEIEPITDLRTFAIRLRDLDVVTQIEAKVHPPNPLFGRAWESLDEYIENRNAKELTISEQATKESPLRTKLLDLAVTLSQDHDDDRIVGEVDLTDAAVLMAADGYGSGKVTGYGKDIEMVVLTAQNQLSFLFAKQPAAEALASEALKRFTRESERRGLMHL
jgi:hypothetical protein